MELFTYNGHISINSGYFRLSPNEREWNTNSSKELENIGCSVKTANIQKELENIGYTQSLVEDFGMPEEFDMPDFLRQSLSKASQFSTKMIDIGRELNAQELLKPTKRADIESALDTFEFPIAVKDLILEFTTAPIAVMTEEFYRQRKWFQTDDINSFSKDVVYSGGLITDGYYDNMGEHRAHYWYKLQSIKDFWISIQENRARSSLWDDFEDAMYSIQEYRSAYIDQFRIGFLEATGICDKYDRDSKVAEFQDISHYKIPVLYERREYHGMGVVYVDTKIFQPPQWAKYISPFGLKAIRMKFTSGLTVLKAVHLDVHNDLKYLLGEMIKDIVRFIRTQIKLMTDSLFDDIELCGKRWGCKNGGLTAIRLNEFHTEHGLGEDDIVGFPDPDPIKESRQTKWQRTKEKPQPKRRQKYDKEKKFRRNRVHNKAYKTQIGKVHAKKV